MLPAHGDAPRPTRRTILTPVSRFLLASLTLLGSHVPAHAGVPPQAESALDRREAPQAAAQSSELQEAERLQQRADKSARERKYDAAIADLQSALTIREKAQGAEHAEVARVLNDLGVYYFSKGDYARASVPLARALSIREKALGPEHPDVAETLTNLAGLYQTKGEYVQAEPLYRRALAIREKARGADHPDTANTLSSLATLYERRGDRGQAEPLHRRALAIREKALGPEHPLVAVSLNNLARLYLANRDYARAEALFQRSLQVREKALGPEHPDVATPLNNLASLYFEQGTQAKAEPLYRRALALREKVLGAEHPDLVRPLVNLAETYRMLGDYARAEPHYRRALALAEKAFGPEHPEVARTLLGFTLLYERRGDAAAAVRSLARANDIRERTLALVLTTGSEAQKLLYLQTLSDETDITVSLHFRNAPSDSQAARLALTTVLRRKGRALDAMSNSIEALRGRANEEDRALLGRLSATRAQLARLVLGGPGKGDPAQHRAEVSALEAAARGAEDAISARSAEFRAQSQPVTLEAVQRAIPPAAALVELVAYRPFNVTGRTNKESFDAVNYAAYVLRGGGPPVWVGLGEAAPIDAMISRLRAALRNPQRSDAKRLARAVEEKLTRPVRKLLGPTHTVFLAPDGALNLIPFGALVDEQGRYLVETYTFTYLTSGRDLLRRQVKVESKEPPVVIANPSFDAGPPGLDGPTSAAGAGAQNRSSASLRTALFESLPGTAGEAKAIQSILPDALVLTGEQATEARLKGLRGPRLLHVATHGFFLSDERDESGGTRGLSLATGGGAAAQGAGGQPENPLLRSGLVLAGVNRRQSGAGEDGVLTALEAAGLDLWGARLVVLSACETGVGDVSNGEGVYGLRRALVLAGSESQVMSLWKVSDTATRDLMAEYYRRLRAGEGRTEALRRAQLGMLRGGRPGENGRARGLGEGGGAGNRRHPFFWAGFIQSGESRAITQ